MIVKKLVFKKDAPDELKISLGMEFSREFSRSAEPFILERKYADAVLRSYSDFECVEVIQLSEDNVSEFKKEELVVLADDRGIKGADKLTKGKLVKALLGISPVEAEPEEVGSEESEDSEQSEGETEG